MTGNLNERYEGAKLLWDKVSPYVVNHSAVSVARAFLTELERECADETSEQEDTERTA